MANGRFNLIRFNRQPYVVSGAASLLAHGSLAAATGLSARLAGRGTMQATALRTTRSSAALAGHAVIGATGRRTLFATGPLNGRSQMQASGRVWRVTGGQLAAVAELTGAAQVIEKTKRADPFPLAAKGTLAVSGGIIALLVQNTSRFEGYPLCRDSDGQPGPDFDYERGGDNHDFEYEHWEDHKMLHWDELVTPVNF